MSAFRIQIYFTYLALVFLASCSNESKPEQTEPAIKVNITTSRDSMLMYINSPNDDTLKVQALYSLCWNTRKNNPDSAILLGIQARSLSEKLNYFKGLTYSNANLASTYRILGKYDSAIACNQRAYFYASLNGDSAMMGKVTGNLGTVYLTQGMYPEALNQYLQGLAMAERRRDTASIGVNLANIGTVYIWQDKPDSAKNYFNQALVLERIQNDSEGIAFNLEGIASACGYKGEVDSAYYYYRIVYDMLLRTGTKYDLEKVVGNLGISWMQQADSAIDPRVQRQYRDSSAHYFRWAINLANEINDRRGVALNTGNLGRIYAQINKSDTAEILFLEAIRLTDSLNILEAKKDNEYNLSLLYDSLGRYEDAYTHYKIYVENRDSLVNEEKSAEMTRAQMNFGFQKERALELAKTEEERARQKLMLNVAIGGGILLLLVAIISIRAYRTKKRSGEIIAQQKREVENQKVLVEAKQKEIIDSINYAQRIQSAILPATGEIQNIFPECFVLFNPKDIVSGDFYWMAKTKDYNFICAADCTGHGVPGGFMSMLGHSMLNEVVLEKQITNTGDILDQLRAKIINSLKQKGESGENKDGMDLALCCFTNDFRKLTFSCANNPLWICRKGEMLEFKADKQPVGIGPVTHALPFRQQEFDLQPGDCIYMFTDGYADQFGGPKGKKFKYKALMELLVRNSDRPMNEQRELLQQALADWKGNLAQIDDVLAIGIKVSISGHHTL